MPEKTPTATISFRANPDLLRLIDEAREPFGISSGEWVRGVVSAHLRSDKPDPNRETEIHSMLEHLAADQQLTRTGLMRLAYVLLTDRGTRSPEEAKGIVQRCFGD